ncbi:MAG: NIL domain-containing protein [Candidatus Omnitrophica bacterium]|nr:NIL domain-containing protein [Candidatus Omnitrophota bacterium]
MAKRRITLFFPQELIKEPVIYKMAKECNVIPNIRRAKVTETVGEVTLELEGTDADLEKGIAYLKRAGVKVQPVEGDVVSN